MINRILCTSCILLLFAMEATGTPKVIAHRGGAALRPENTLAAFQHAIRLGVDVLEFDMNVSADDRIVIHHDSSVNSTVCKPAPGAQVSPGPIRSLTWAQIQQFDCGTQQRANSPAYQPAPGARMPSLDQFLTAVKNSSVLLLGETKIPPTNVVAPDRLASLIYGAIQKHGLLQRFILQTTDYAVADAMRKKDPRVKICLLSARRFKPHYLPTARQHGATHMMLRWDDASLKQVRQLQSAGIEVYSSTANTAEDWQKYVELGMDGILTDDPAGLMEFLRKGRSQQ